MSDQPFLARIWGSRGSLATFGPAVQKYGGNTACIEIICNTHRLIFDAGTGIRPLGEEIMQEVQSQTSTHGAEFNIDLFFTHCHYDHIAGLPFFAPFFSADHTINIYSGHLTGHNKTQNMIKNYMHPPYFPVGPEVFCAKVQYCDFSASDTLSPQKDITIRTIALDHHDHCIGYRIEFDQRAICYITDVNHRHNEPNQALINFIQNADLLIYDSTYTDEEFEYFAHFGHSTWQEGMRLAQAANVSRYCIFHHRPCRSDADLDEILMQCRTIFKDSWVAYEGLTIKV